MRDRGWGSPNSDSDEGTYTVVLSKPVVIRPARLHRMDTVPAFVDWRACTATQLSGVSSSKTPATGMGKVPPHLPYTNS